MKKALALLALVILIVGIVAGIYLVSRQQNIKSKATGSSVNGQTYDMGVLVLKYFPVTADGRNIDINVTGDIGDSYATISQRVNDVTDALKTSLEKSSTYLGYKDSTATPSLNYRIVDTKEYKTGVPMLTNGSRKPNYNQIMQQHGICNLVDNQGVREVWIWAYQGPSVFPNPDGSTNKLPYLAIWESTMQGPSGFYANGGNENMPVCGHTYRVYTFNYNSGTANAIESWGHQIEAEMKAVDTYLYVNKFQGAPYPACDPNNPINIDGTTVNEKKLKCARAKDTDYLGNPTAAGVGRCGSVHNPPNARYEYDRANPTPNKSDCLDWTPDSLGQQTDISCSIWGCADTNIINNNSSLNFQIWMFQNMPGKNNTKTYQGRQLRNWWDVHGDFDNVMRNNKTLFTSNQTSAPTSSPTSSAVYVRVADSAQDLPNTQERLLESNSSTTWNLAPQKLFDSSSFVDWNSLRVNSPKTVYVQFKINNVWSATKTYTFVRSR